MPTEQVNAAQKKLGEDIDHVGVLEQSTTINVDSAKLLSKTLASLASKVVTVA